MNEEELLGVIDMMSSRIGQVSAHQRSMEQRIGNLEFQVRSLQRRLDRSDEYAQEMSERGV